MAGECPHLRWIVQDSLQLGMVRCTDCNVVFNVVVALNDMSRRVDECIRMVYARMGMVEPNELLVNRLARRQEIEQAKPTTQVTQAADKQARRMARENLVVQGGRAIEREEEDPS